eukprot:TRINITY_DN15044_c1_g4_i1.p1 TRINITY_DN15044_c1_g4~~TRINITY_DN15044_c1_g4_i1.p1  ORF type:complete len:359 (+),score=119.50 TRINITY_DN15044_c1_g4_i1:76-1077(+)
MAHRRCLLRLAAASLCAAPAAATATASPSGTASPGEVNSTSPTAAPATAAPSGDGAADGHARWTYADPHEWYAQSAEWVECGNSLQSPVSLTTHTAEPAQAAFFKIWQPRQPPRPVVARHTGHSISVAMRDSNITLSSSVVWSQYRLAEMHYHAPSEHVIDGRRRPLERHMVFEPRDQDALTAAGNLRTPKLVVGVLYDVSDAQGDPVLEMLISQGNLSATLSAGSSVELPPVDLPAFGFLEDRCLSYAGSLTTPPCSEVVHWVVSTAVQPATLAQLQLMSDLVNAMPAAAAAGSPTPSAGTLQPARGTARPLQPLNGRTVKLRHHFTADPAE